MFYFLLRSTISVSLMQFSMYLMTGLFCIVAFLFCFLLFAFSLLMMKIFVRFQYKLTILFILLGQQAFAFRAINKVCLLCVHAVMLLLGGFGYLLMLFLEM